jgi:hypothetical protein
MKAQAKGVWAGCSFKRFLQSGFIDSDGTQQQIAQIAHSAMAGGS